MNTDYVETNWNRLVTNVNIEESKSLLRKFSAYCANVATVPSGYSFWYVNIQDSNSRMKFSTESNEKDVPIVDAFVFQSQCLLQKYV